jgi:hypothetical protein
MMRLGPIERQILLACLDAGGNGSPAYTPDLYRDELPAILWGWKAVTKDSPSYLSERDWTTYPKVAPRAYRTGQATLTRALRSLYRKGLIDCGGAVEATGLEIYSPVQARALGIAPKAPRTPEEMRKRNALLWGGTSLASQGIKPRWGRNIRSLRLTEAGAAVATQLVADVK